MVVVRPADLSTDSTVIDAVKALGAAAVAIFLAATNQLSNVLPTQRNAFRKWFWGPVLAITLAAALATPIYIYAFGYFSKQAAAVLIGLILLEMILLIVLVLSRAEIELVEPVAPNRSLPPDDVAYRLEEATAGYDLAAEDLDEATREADLAAQRYDEAVAAYRAAGLPRS